MVASGGDVVGALATLAGYGLDRAGRVLASGVALRIDRDELVDLWTDRPGLLRQLLATTLRSMDLPPARPVSGAPARAVALTA
jgi:hypothetical protein